MMPGLSSSCQLAVKEVKCAISGAESDDFGLKLYLCFARVLTRASRALFTPSLSLGRYTKSVRKKNTGDEELRSMLAKQVSRGWQAITQRVVVVVGVTPVTTTIGMQVPQQHRNF